MCVFLGPFIWGGGEGGGDFFFKLSCMKFSTAFFPIFVYQGVSLSVCFCCSFSFFFSFFFFVVVLGGIGLF